jgi:hypothetical protein
MREGSQRLHHLVAVSCLRRKPGVPAILFCLGQICPAKAPSTIRALFAVMSRTLGEVRGAGGKDSERREFGLDSGGQPLEGCGRSLTRTEFIHYHVHWQMKRGAFKEQIGTASEDVRLQPQSYGRALAVSNAPPPESRCHPPQNSRHS